MQWYCIETSIIFVCLVHNVDEIEGCEPDCGNDHVHRTQNRPAPREYRAMSKFHTQRFRVQKPAPGMSRFFSPANLDRYRKLASGTGEAEQQQLFEDLAEEINAFRREARVASVYRPLPSNVQIGSPAGD